MLKFLHWLVAPILLMPWIGDWHWFLSLLSHFQIQATFLLLVLLGFFLWKKEWKSVGQLGALLLVAAWHILPLLYGSATVVAESEFRVTSLNVLSSNQDEEAVFQYLRDAESDVVCLIEVTSRWEAELRNEYSETYPHQVSEPRPGNFGMMLLSRWPILSQKVHSIGSLSLPLLEVCLQKENELVTVLVIHPIPPLGGRNALGNANYLDETEKIYHSVEGAAIVVGDFNSTPWGAGYKKLVKNCALKNSLDGERELTTWNYLKWKGFPLVGLHLDHILYSEDLIKIESDVGPFVGSDHFGVTADFLFRH